MTDYSPPPAKKLPDWGNAEHTAWERHLHRQEASRVASCPPMTNAERTEVVTKYVQRYPAAAENIVHCEVCEKRLCEALLDGRNIFEMPRSMPALLNKYGISIPGRRR
jgi:hypothetical protein